MLQPRSYCYCNHWGFVGKLWSLSIQGRLVFICLEMSYAAKFRTHSERRRHELCLSTRYLLWVYKSIHPVQHLFESWSRFVKAKQKKKHWTSALANGLLVKKDATQLADKHIAPNNVKHRSQLCSQSDRDASIIYELGQSMNLNRRSSPCNHASCWLSIMMMRWMIHLC